MDVMNAICRIQRQKRRALAAIIEANFTEMGREYYELYEDAEACEAAFWREFFVWRDSNTPLSRSGKSDSKQFEMRVHEADESWYKVWHNAMDRYITTTKSEEFVRLREERIKRGDKYVRF